ncbi:MAG TPA: ribosome maturation factor RimP [Tissierellaceae bacterium]|nr:ribosome maturation factor RimP [Tissierellaceae bacterium]
MSKGGAAGAVESIAEPLAKELGFELVDVEFKKEGPNYFLRIFLDKTGGITLDDCQKMSERLSEALDDEDPITVPYYLEVSSPGLDRPLKTNKDLKRNLGKELDIKLYEAINGKKILQGILREFNEEEIKIEIDNNEFIEIPRSSIVNATLAVKF